MFPFFTASRLASGHHYNRKEYMKIELTLNASEWLKLNAGLQKKKNALRKELASKGVLKKGAKNDFDHYNYFSEAQYKELFTELMSKVGLELKFNEIEYNTFDGTEKQANGRMPKLEFTLFDCDTGFYEETLITGEGIDKGDKAGYKAYTGALKYYLANTFMVATGDDPEKESPSNKMNNVTKRNPAPQPKSVEKPAVSKRQMLVDFCNRNGLVMAEIAVKYKLNKNTTEERFAEVLKELLGEINAER